jgi:hypothetical protein
VHWKGAELSSWIDQELGASRLQKIEGWNIVEQDVNDEK